ncbi:alpha/beta hydrolase [Microbacterium protaetiae]|uniref:Alpha/beta hydrolase n=1 Tax=Microbacterium protaetiae TaxID=2509458 RepID=A0A4P6E9V5_9MICO|nr:alpha/beta hydrolase [Microbacterium protaetiae]QAY58815.1 alpha/beta hydrolase [Microbacterium protaetiae]
MSTFTTHSVRSSDGTPIGFRRTGSGPPLVLVHGGLLASQHLVALAAELADEFEVIVPDRRGRGMSGPYGDGASRIVDREAADIRAVIDDAGAHDLFALSSGALVSLEAVRTTDSITRLALYEPPLSINGSVPRAWVDRYEAEVSAGRIAAALITGMRGLRIDPVMSRIPHLAAPMLEFVLRHESLAEGEVSIRDLVPTWHYDVAIIDELADRARDYAGVTADVLLLGGGKSPAFLTRALDELELVLPRAQRITFPRLRHQAAVDQPDQVAAVLREFFARGI